MNKSSLKVQRTGVLSFCLVFLLSTFLPQVGLHRLDVAENLETEALAKIEESYGQVPLVFEQNVGQTDEQVKFLNRSGNTTTYFTPTESVMVRSQDIGDEENSKLVSDVLRMTLDGANKNPEIAGLDEQGTKSNYFIGNNPDAWQQDITNYKKVKYKQVYPGIDLVYYGNNSKMEHDFVVSPGTDPDQISIKFEGAKSTSIDSDGNLVLDQENGSVVFKKPFTYQETKDNEVKSSYVLAEDNAVKFALADYDPNKELTIDPVALAYSSYLGGTGNDMGWTITVDSAGAAYVSGSTTSTDFPTASAYQGSNAGGGDDLFVTKFSVAGTSVDYSTYIGGSGDDLTFRSGIAVDSSGNAYLAGTTDSTDFPTASAYDGTRSGTNDAFLTKLSSTGSSLIYSTYLGGTATDGARDIFVDASGSAYVVGITTSTNFPTASAYQGSKNGVVDGFITKFNAAGSALVYSTYLGGSDGSTEEVEDIAVDVSGNAYFVGYTNSTDFPTVSPYQGSNAGSTDTFFGKLNSTGAVMSYLSYFGGSSSDTARAMAIDASGNLYITGVTISTDLPTASAYQGSNAGANDAFLTKINSTGSALVYSTYFGGTGSDFGYGLAVDSGSNVYLGGITTSTNLPTVLPYQGTYGGGVSDAFAVKFTASGSVEYSTYLGGSGTDDSRGLAINSTGNAFLTGWTSSANFPYETSFQSSNAGGTNDAFVTKLAFSNPISPALSDPTPSATGVTYTHTLDDQSTDTIRCITTRYTDTIGIDSKPTGMDISGATLSSSTTMVPTPASWSASPNDATGVITTTFATGESPVGGNNQELIFDNITNGSIVATSYFVEVKTFSDVGCTVLVDSFVPAAFIYADGVVITGQVYPTLTFTVDDTVCELGPVTASTTGTCIHTMTAGTNGSNGYAISYIPTNTLTSGSDTISATGITGATSSQGSEQFGLNLKDNATPDIGAEASGGVGVASANYNVANTFSFTTGGAQVAESSTLSDTTTYTVSYIANVANTTEAGNYSTTQTYNIVASY